LISPESGSGERITRAIRFRIACAAWARSTGSLRVSARRATLVRKISEMLG
jgi:hypothetical protein